jgi:hypothetical protein
MRKVERLIDELERSENVKHIDHHEHTIDENAVRERHSLTVTFTDEGYNFDLLHARFPGLNVCDIAAMSGGVTAVLTIPVVDE